MLLVELFYGTGRTFLSSLEMLNFAYFCIFLNIFKHNE